MARATQPRSQAGGAGALWIGSEGSTAGQKSEAKDYSQTRLAEKSSIGSRLIAGRPCRCLHQVEALILAFRDDDQYAALDQFTNAIEIKPVR
jgi:hypothetical protein